MQVHFTAASQFYVYVNVEFYIHMNVELFLHAFLNLYVGEKQVCLFYFWCRMRMRPARLVSNAFLYTTFGANFSKNFFAQCSVEGRVFENFQKKLFSKFQKCPKVFPKVSKRVLNMFWGKIFEKFYAQCSMKGRVFEIFQNNQKICKIPKMPKIVPKSIQTCFELVLGQIF